MTGDLLSIILVHIMGRNVTKHIIPDEHSSSQGYEAFRVLAKILARHHLAKRPVRSAEENKAQHDKPKSYSKQKDKDR